MNDPARPAKREMRGAAISGAVVSIVIAGSVPISEARRARLLHLPGCKKAMNASPTTMDAFGSSELRERTAGLNVNGMHYLIGWVVSAGFQKPDVFAELEFVLDELQTAPDLQHCWIGGAEDGKTAPSHWNEIPPEAGHALTLDADTVPALPVVEQTGPAPSEPVRQPRRGKLSRILGRVRKVFKGRSEPINELPEMQLSHQ